MEFHDAANIFPLDEDHLHDLADDIREHGQHQPIEVYDGKILDGRRRWKACKMAGVIPQTVEVDPDDPVAYVLSLNLQRRHLTETQRAMVGARARQMYDDAAKERQAELGKSHGDDPGGKFTTRGKARDAAGKAVGVSGKSIDYATRVIAQGVPELVDAVDADKIAVSTAARMSSWEPNEQREFVQSAKGRPAARQNRIEEHTEPQPNGKVRGVGIQRAHEAIACLKQIPKNDALRKRGFQVVTDWIKHNQ